MPVKLALPANEESTYVIQATFTDEDGAPVVPSAVSWSLRNRHGVIVNDREDIAIAPESQLDIVLYGDDLDVEAHGRLRVITISATYDSDIGQGMPLTEEAELMITPLMGL